MGAHLLFIGSPLLDVSLRCGPDHLDKYNLERDNCIRATEEHRNLFTELLQHPDSKLQAGGSSQNSARVCKWVLGRTEGVVAFAGCVGKDNFAVKMEEQLKKDRVDPLYTVHPTKPTGVCACLVGPNGERSMITDHGASSTYDVCHLESAGVRSHMEKAHAIFVVGYFLCHSPNVVKSVAHFCSSRKKLFAISLSAPYICRDYGDLLMECISHVDVIFGNNSEAKVFVEKALPDVKCESPKQYAKVIAQLPKCTSEVHRVVIITNGRNPVTVCVTNGTSEEFPVPQVDNLVETVGCGDALAGAFLATFVKTRSSSKSIEAGILAATSIAQTHGCTIPKECYPNLV